MDDLTRRSTLRLGAGAAAALAGCLGGGAGAETGGTEVRASFFVLGSFAEAIAGDAATAETVVPFGQHGHGWEPSATVQRDVAGADLFVYVGEGFQPWADDVVTNLRTDDTDVSVVAAREGVELLPASGREHGRDGDHEESDHDSEGDHEAHHDEDGDGHGTHDPHFWLDPTRAGTAVENVRDGFLALEDGNGDAYRTNADAYLDRLAALDDDFETALADAGLDSVLVAGHDGFQYLGHRYGFEVRALTGLSPDEEPSTRQIREAQEVVDREGIRHVLAPVFESDRAAEQLVAETDARGVLPITTVAGQTERWADDGWGYEDVMRGVNLPSLRTALDA